MRFLGLDADAFLLLGGGAELGTLRWTRRCSPRVFITDSLVSYICRAHVQAGTEDVWRTPEKLPGPGLEITVCVGVERNSLFD
jgi:hypothetical protein